MNLFAVPYPSQIIRGESGINGIKECVIRVHQKIIPSMVHSTLFVDLVEGEHYTDRSDLTCCCSPPMLLSAFPQLLLTLSRQNVPNLQLVLSSYSHSRARMLYSNDEGYCNTRQYKRFKNNSHKRLPVSFPIPEVAAPLLENQPFCFVFDKLGMVITVEGI